MNCVRSEQLAPDVVIRVYGLGRESTSVLTIACDGLADRFIRRRWLVDSIAVW